MIDNIISERHCKRSFLKKKVAKSILKKVLVNAANAASSKNTQPWKVCVLTNKTKNKLIETMCQKFDQNEFESEDYNYMINPLPTEFKDRARECGYTLYQLKGIHREDKEARKAHFRENYTFFNAPVGLIFHLPMGSERGNFLDMGGFLQNVMLGLVSEGLGSCPQFSICAYSHTIRQMLNLKDRIIVCGMSVGYPDETAVVNTFIPKRIKPNRYIEWFD